MLMVRDIPKTILSVTPPVFIIPEEEDFNGQNGLIPATVKLSANK